MHVWFSKERKNTLVHHSVRSNDSVRKVLQLSHKVSAVSPSVKLKIQPQRQLQKLHSPAGIYFFKFWSFSALLTVFLVWSWLCFLSGGQLCDIWLHHVSDTDTLSPWDSCAQLLSFLENRLTFENQMLFNKICAFHSEASYCCFWSFVDTLYLWFWLWTRVL